MAAASPVQYAKSGDIDVAYQTHASGPPDLVFVVGSISHLDVLWEDPSYRRFCERLASFSRLIRFDKRGMGLSDRVAFGPLEERMDDHRAVMDATGSERAALFGVSEGAPLSMLFAATYPERTEVLILCGGEVKEETTDDWPWGEWTREELDASMELVHERWGLGHVIEHVAPSLKDDPEARRWAGRLQVQSMGPGDAISVHAHCLRNRRPRHRAVRERSHARHPSDR